MHTFTEKDSYTVNSDLQAYVGWHVHELGLIVESNHILSFAMLHNIWRNPKACFKCYIYLIGTK